MLENSSTRKIVIFIVAAVVLGGLVFLWGVSSNDDASISAKDLADFKTRLGKLEARVAALEFSNGGGRASKDIEASLSDLRSRETNLLLRLCDVEEKLGITPPVEAPIPTAAPAPVYEPPAETLSVDGAPVKEAITQEPPVQSVVEKKTMAQEKVVAAEPVSKVEKSAPMSPPPSPAGDGGPAVYHQVEKGDTVYSVSQRYGLTPDALRQINGLESNTILPGQRLRVTP